MWFSFDNTPLLLPYAMVAVLILVSLFNTIFSLARSSKACRINLANLGAWGGRRWYCRALLYPLDYFFKLHEFHLATRVQLD